jgi:hypothetical protein
MRRPKIFHGKILGRPRVARPEDFPAENLRAAPGNPSEKDFRA